MALIFLSETILYVFLADQPRQEMTLSSMARAYRDDPARVEHRDAAALGGPLCIGEPARRGVAGVDAAEDEGSGGEERGGDVAGHVCHCVSSAQPCDWLLWWPNISI